MADIAARFDWYEGIQPEAAEAWANTVLAEVKFDAAALVEHAMSEVDKLAGLGQQ